MKTFEIKGFWGFIIFTVVSLVVLSLAVTIPISISWVTWNAIIGEVLHGPMIEFWQAAILTAAIAVACQIVFQPQISVNVKRVKSPDELDKHLRNFKEQDSAKD